MYIVSNEITVTWVLGPTDAPLTAADYDINIVPSTLGATYTDAGIVNYVAPTSVSAGSLQYLFTPLSAGRYRLYLTTGTNLSYTILDEKDFWVFLEAPVSANSLKVLGAVSYPEPALFYTTTGIALTWYRIHGITGDPNNSDVLWICGHHTFADTLLSVASVTISTGAVVEYQDVVTNVNANPGGKGLAIDPTGRIVLLKNDQEAGNVYEAYYGDAPYTTWTKCTRDASFPTASAGQQGIWWDSYLEVWFWLTGTRLGISSDGITWYNQQYNFNNDGSSFFDVSSAGWMYRVKTANVNRLHIGRASLGGGKEDSTYSVAAPPVTVPFSAALIKNNQDVFGAGYTSKKIVTAAIAPSGTEVILMGGDGFLITTIGPDDADVSSVVDVKAQTGYTGVAYYFFWLADFNKYMMYTGNPDAWCESDDAVTWTLSTDTRFTTLDNLSIWGFKETIDFWRYPEDRGVAWIHYNGSTHDLVITK